MQLLVKQAGDPEAAHAEITKVCMSTGNRNDVSVDTYNRTEIAPVVERDLTTRVATSRPAMLTTWNDGAAHRRCKNCKILLLLVKALNNKEVNKRVKVK
jgi:hypothetical protein